MSSTDPTAIRVLAVTAEDLVAAVEANERRDADAVLRVTPPFSGRMRARLHLDGAEHGYESTQPLHIPPERFVSEVPPAPTPDETADTLRNDPDETYTQERHRERHEAVLSAWRQQLKEATLDAAHIETPSGEHEVRVTWLG
ncbi:uncharacterized protein NP_2646A [Natronomonas pharaonis DSM 2160]|uniref:DUF8009 domain-containing protein n=1 Tax=Natronomonas pharaonis (strain ATCC 35678 / DSM 2160 / CIP 103997 / JCM 8858 / NBRC 14720 / NCIMB 2260 / Gabara) TaxID=348780 RepID=A0A1U7EWD9_NATPD|nr:hypothetical protein [Natronomonas pharaonis]CAI49414.1 uncharacterized protein NP_2646A [Natronomonas pharaonis DSM 2160]